VIGSGDREVKPPKALKLERRRLLASTGFRPHVIAFGVIVRAEARMTQTSNRLFDEMARLMNDAAGVAEGVRREIQTLVQSQAERILRDMDVVTREEFEAVKEMAAKAREENERLAAKLAEVENKLGSEPAKRGKGGSGVV
jgi:BMFP domain-containing protein YqiC